MFFDSAFIYLFLFVSICWNPLHDLKYPSSCSPRYKPQLLFCIESTPAQSTWHQALSAAMGSRPACQSAKAKNSINVM